MRGSPDRAALIARLKAREDWLKAMGRAGITVILDGYRIAPDAREQPTTKEDTKR